MNPQVTVTRRKTLLGATTLAAASALGVEMDFASSRAFAQTTLAPEPGKLAPLPDKLPPSVEARVGKIEFNRGFPTQRGIDQLFEIQDFQRATQLYQWAIPAIGTMGWHRASIANGKTGETDWVVYDDYTARQGILTPTIEVSYVMAFPDLFKTGPLVLDYGPGKIAGIVMDYWQRPQFDFGLTGPERGATRGKALLLGPRQKAPDDIGGYHVVHVPTRVAFIGYRVLDRSDKDKITPLNKLYPYTERNNPPLPKVIAATRDYTQSAPRGMAYWEAVNELIQREPVEERDRFFYAMLAGLGIEKGKPLAPNDKHKKLLEDAALLGEEISRARFPDDHYVYHYKDQRGEPIVVKCSDFEAMRSAASDIRNRAKTQGIARSGRHSTVWRRWSSASSTHRATTS